MATAWLTYAWADNESKDVDYVAQELTREGIAIKLDRWNLGAGKKLWDQIADKITNPDQCDAWVLYATQNSLGSEPCKEEFAYALGRALKTRGEQFPVIGLFPSPVDNKLIPPAISARLYVSTTDPNWKERVVAAVEGREPSVARPEIRPYEVKVHTINKPDGLKYAIEMRPRAGTWCPFIFAMLDSERDRVKPEFGFKPKNKPHIGGIVINPTSTTQDELWLWTAQNEATPTQSFYLLCHELPSVIIFGVNGDKSQQYEVSIQRSQNASRPWTFSVLTI